MDENSYKAVVQKIVRQGAHGPYAVATEAELVMVTFSLEPDVWEEKTWPEEGDVVVLSEIRKKRAGWRANRGRFLQQSDEKQKRKGEAQK